MKRKMMIMILAGALLCGNLAPVNLKQAEAASASKTVTVTLDKASPDKRIVLRTNVKKPSGYKMKDWEAFYNKAGVQIYVILSLDGIKGVSKITYKLTFTNPSGKKSFKSLKVKKI